MLVELIRLRVKEVESPTDEWKESIGRYLDQFHEIFPSADPSIEMVLTPSEAKEYLTAAVRRWRTNRDAPIVSDSAEDGRQADLKAMAPYYIDAFQSVLVSLFGETVPGVDKVPKTEEL